jgi:hypothetical protein
MVSSKIRLALTVEVLLYKVFPSFSKGMNFCRRTFPSIFQMGGSSVPVRSFFRTTNLPDLNSFLVGSLPSSSWPELSDSSSSSSSSMSSSSSSSSSVLDFLGLTAGFPLLGLLAAAGRPRPRPLPRTPFFFGD